MSEWCRYNFKSVESFYNRNDILNQNLWFNSCIRVANKPQIYKLWYEANIKIIGNLVHNGKWKNIEDIEREYGIKPPLLEYLGILNSIPPEWRRIIKNIDNLVYFEETYTSNIDRLCNIDKVNKVIYKELVEDISIEPTERWYKWLEELEVNVTELDWLDSFPRIYKCTTSTRLRSLGYRFLIRDVLTNTKLIHMGKSDSIHCYLCKTEIETITHLYWACPTTRRLWERLKLFVLESMGFTLELEPLELLLGVSKLTPDEGPTDIIYLLSLITKSYIHACKCKNIFPNDNGLISKIKYIKNMELAIATKKGVAATLNHYRKWYWMDNPQT